LGSKNNENESGDRTEKETKEKKLMSSISKIKINKTQCEKNICVIAFTKFSFILCSLVVLIPSLRINGSGKLVGR